MPQEHPEALRPGWEWLLPGSGVCICGELGVLFLIALSAGSLGEHLPLVKEQTEKRLLLDGQCGGKPRKDRHTTKAPCSIPWL